MVPAAVEGLVAPVIGGTPAAATVFARDVKLRTEADPRVKAALRGRGSEPFRAPRQRPRAQAQEDRSSASKAMAATPAAICHRRRPKYRRPWARAAEVAATQCYFALEKLSGSMPACFRMARSVPSGMSPG
jgi:hypothetical protein